MTDDLFFSDIDFPGQYYGVLVRSTIQRGRLVDIKPPALPDGYYLYTATDIPGENKLSALGTSIPIFTPYEIHYLGEPLGILVGPDLETVHELVSEVLIETETLEPYRFGEKFSSAQIVGKRILVSGDPDTVLQNAAKVYEDTYSTGPQDHYYAEPLGAVVNLANGKLEIFTATQWPFHVRSAVSAMLDLDPNEISVTPTAIGEAMDGKIWFPSLIAAQASLAAVLCKRPVKISFSRQEDFLFSVKSAPVQIRYRTAIADDGSIQAMIVRILVNSGAYSPLIDEIIDRITVSATGLYAINSYRIETYALRTSLPPMGALSGWGETQAFFALENHVASIVSGSGASPVEWKMMNTLTRGKKNVTRTDAANDMRLAELFGAVCTASDFPRKYTAYANLNSRRSGYRDGPVRGIGIACGFQGNGFIGKTNDIAPYSVEITMETDGQVHIKSGFYSAHMRAIICRLAAASLGIEDTLISFTGNNTSSMSETGPETLSSKIAILAPLVEKCCTTIQKQRFRQPLPITVKKTYKPSKNDAWDSTSLQGKPFVSITPGVCAVELELDPLTYEAKIRGIWIACDAGKLYDKTGALTTIRKTIPAALSRMIAEHIDVRDGKLMPKDSVQYDLLPPSLVPECHITFLDSTEAPRGIGSIAHNLVPAAYAIALSQITGKPVNSVPLDPQAIYEALEPPVEES